MSNIFSLSNKVAVITGASSGIGVQFAKALSKEGAKVALFARRADKLEAVASEIKSAGGEVLVVPTDMSKETEVEASMKKVADTWGGIDILVNNAGVAAIAPAENMTLADWDKVVSVNLTGVFLGAKHAAKYMIAKKYGKIINTSSMFGVVANTCFPVVSYHATKFGVVGLTKALATEWAKYGITVNAIGPGFFESEMTQASIHTKEFEAYLKASCPMGRHGAEGELNGTLLLLASDASRYLTGQIIAVDGGWTAI